MKKRPNPFRIGSNDGADKRIGRERQGFRADTPFHPGGPRLKTRGMNPPSTILASTWVALGGGIGAVLRYQLGRGMTHWLGVQAVTAFPWATLATNVIGSLAMGLLAGLLARHGQGGEHWRLLAGVGLLGGFTTFSAFSLEMMMLIERGQAAQAFIYAAISVLAGLSALYVGLILMRLAG
jgi:CrcB protein